jgi:hypothetical protein
LRRNEDRCSQKSRLGVFGKREHVPGNVDPGDGLQGETIAGLDTLGEGTIGQLDGAHSIPVQTAFGEFLLHGPEISPDEPQVASHERAKEAEQHARAKAHGGIGGSHAPGANRDHLGGCARIPRYPDKGESQPLMEVRGRDHRGQSIVVLGEVGTQGGDHYVGIVDGLSDEVGVEDIGVDQDLDLATGRDVRHGSVDGPDRMSTPGGKIDEMLADRPRSSENGDVHDENSGLCLRMRTTTAKNDDAFPATYGFGGLECSYVYGEYTV